MHRSQSSHLKNGLSGIERISFGDWPEFKNKLVGHAQLSMSDRPDVPKVRPSLPLESVSAKMFEVLVEHLSSPVLLETTF